MTAKNIFEELNKVDVSKFTENKNGLSYLSWADSWTEICKRYPETNYTVYESDNNTPLHTMDGRSGYVKVGVTVEGKEIIEYLAVMGSNGRTAMPFNTIMSTDVVRTIQRCATKAIARHGLGMHVYRGEDLPEGDAQEKDADNRPKGPGRPTAKDGHDLAAVKAHVIKAKQDPAVKIVIDERLAAWGKKNLSELDGAEWGILHGTVSKAMASVDRAEFPHRSAETFVTGEDLVNGSDFPPAPEGTEREVPFPEDPQDAMDEIARIRATNINAKKSLDAAMKAADKQFMSDLDEIQLRSMWEIAQKARRGQ